MDPVLKKVTAFIRSNRYVLVVLAVGLVLMLLPSPGEETAEAAETVERTPDVQAALAQILSAVDGVGQVQVMLTVAEGERIIYQSDESSTATDTVIITHADRSDSGLVQQTIPPAYLGAIVVCQGADSASVRLQVVEAVSKVTGLSADRITVLKMK